MFVFKAAVVGAGRHQEYPCAAVAELCPFPGDGCDLFVAEGLSADVDRVVVQVFDRSAKPLAIDGLKSKGIIDRVRTDMHAVFFQCEYVVLRPG